MSSKRSCRDDTRSRQMFRASRNSGGVMRPAHIHFRVSELLHVPLTTQLYFKGDPNIANDPWARSKPSMAIDLKQDGKFLHGNLDFVLDNSQATTE